LNFQPAAQCPDPTAFSLDTRHAEVEQTSTEYRVLSYKLTNEYPITGRNSIKRPRVAALTVRNFPSHFNFESDAQRRRSVSSTN